MNVLRRKPAPATPKPEIELYPAFDETSPSGLDETVRNLKILRVRSHSDEEAQRWQLKAFEDLQVELSALRKHVGSLSREVNRKASKVGQAAFEKALTATLEKRIDTIRTVACWAIGTLVAVMAIIKVVH